MSNVYIVGLLAYNNNSSIDLLNHANDLALHKILYIMTFFLVRFVIRSGKMYKKRLL